ncbi:MAG: hypothetical protein ACYC2R_10945 [Burkholderiales bacterium]
MTDAASELDGRTQAGVESAAMKNEGDQRSLAELNGTVQDLLQERTDKLDEEREIYFSLEKEVARHLHLISILTFEDRLSIVFVIAVYFFVFSMLTLDGLFLIKFMLFLTVMVCVLFYLYLPVEKDNHENTLALLKDTLDQLRAARVEIDGQISKARDEVRRKKFEIERMRRLAEAEEQRKQEQAMKKSKAY